jgi:hypothetical protein
MANMARSKVTRYRVEPERRPKASRDIRILLVNRKRAPRGYFFGGVKSRPAILEVPLYFRFPPGAEAPFSFWLQLS